MAKEHSTTESSWYFVGWRKYIDFRGCAGRREFWSFQLSFLVFLLSIFVLEVLFLRPAIDGLIRMDRATLFGPLFYAFLVYMLLPQIAIACRRMHDLGFSGGFAILGFLLWVAFIGFSLALRFATAADPLFSHVEALTQGASYAFAAAAIYQTILLGLFCLPGTANNGD